MRIRSRSQRTSTSISKIVWKTALSPQGGSTAYHCERDRSHRSDLTIQKQQLQKRPDRYGRLTAFELNLGQEKRLVVF